MSEKPEEEILDQLLELAGQHATNVLVSLKMDELVPSWVLISPKDEKQWSVIATPWRGPLDKTRQVNRLVRYMREHAVIAYSFVCEAWAASINPEEGWSPDSGQPLPAHLRASQRPNRREVVMAVAATRATARYSQWLILRDALGAVSELRFEPMAESDIAPESWIANLLK
jgi:hypothetical protein